MTRCKKCWQVDVKVNYESLCATCYPQQLEICGLCGDEVKTADLIDGVCGLCNPDSHTEYELEQQEQELWKG